MTNDAIHAELKRQLGNLVAQGFLSKHQAMHESIVASILGKISLLQEQSLPLIDLQLGTLPFVIVLKRTVISPEEAIRLIDISGKKGVEKMFPKTPSQFQTLSSIELPPTEAYLIADIDRGKHNLNMVPNSAFIEIERAGRSPLTIEEGISILAQYPEFLTRNNCYSLLASRIEGDKRVPAIWLNAKGEPNLGWCWNGNPHTWLGSASCRTRI
jgi:hypothetical protein